jgi:ABC-type uncharacterized transport system substrate-binding protein
VTRREFVLLLSAAMAAARPLRAQQKAMPVIGFLGNSYASFTAPYVVAFRQGLAETGYVEGQNVVIEYRWAEDRFERLPALAADLVARKVDVIFAGAGVGIRAAKNATSTIPIIFFGGGDLVGAGLVASLARPGGNLTGFSMMAPELEPKRFDLLSELVPKARVMGLLVNPPADRALADVSDAARIKGVQLHILRASTESEIETAFAALAQLQAGALDVAVDPFFNSRGQQLAALAAHHAVPAIYQWRETVAAGGLISYGPSQTDVFRRIGAYVGRVLNGEKPADLPIQQPTRFELVINLNTAKALGLTVPPSILARADEVIE